MTGQDAVRANRVTYWIPAHLDLGRHPKTKKLARALGCKLPCAVGHLFYLWWWAMEYAPDGDLSRYDDADIADGIQWEGAPSELIAALTDTGWLNDDRTLHDWNEYGGRVYEEHQRRAERARQARARQATPPQPDDPAPSPLRDQHVPVTEPVRAPLEKKREEKKRREDTPTVDAAAAALAETPPAADDPPANVTPLRSLAKARNTKVDQVVGLVEAANVPVSVTKQDAIAIQGCKQDAPVIAAAYVSAFNGAWGAGDGWLRDNLNLRTVCGRIVGYLAWKSGPTAGQRQRASPVSAAEGFARLARGEGW